MGCACVALIGCTGMQTSPACPDISGSYANQAEGARERLAPLLLGAADRASTAKVVSLSLNQDQAELLATAGAQWAVLKRGSDFVCDARGLRLVRPQQSGVDLGEMLVHQVSRFHTFSKAGDGSLVATKTVKERATIANVPLSGPERQEESVRWRPTAPLAIR
jgi:hypothetical protein